MSSDVIDGQPLGERVDGDVDVSEELNWLSIVLALMGARISEAGKTESLFLLVMNRLAYLVAGMHLVALMASWLYKVGCYLEIK